jgi:hypothetical protein
LLSSPPQAATASRTASEGARWRMGSRERSRAAPPWRGRRPLSD